MVFYTPDLLLRFEKHYCFRTTNMDLASMDLRNARLGVSTHTIQGPFNHACPHHPRHRGDGSGREQWPPAPHRCALGCLVGDGGGSRPLARHGDARDRAMAFLCQPGGPPFRLLERDMFLYSKSLDYHERCRPGKYIFLFIFSECTSNLNFFQRAWFSACVFFKAIQSKSSLQE